jgi:hypothetical protein
VRQRSSCSFAWHFFWALFLYFGKKVEFYPVFGYIIRMVTRKQIKQTKKKGQKQPDYDSAWKDITGKF